MRAFPRNGEASSEYPGGLRRAKDSSGVDRWARSICDIDLTHEKFAMLDGRDMQPFSRYNDEKKERERERGAR